MPKKLPSKQMKVIYPLSEREPVLARIETSLEEHSVPPGILKQIEAMLK